MHWKTLWAFLVPGFCAFCSTPPVTTEYLISKIPEAMNKLPEVQREMIFLSGEDIQEITYKVSHARDETVAENEIGIIITNIGTIVIRFFPDKAPKHCGNFKKLANAGFYDWTLFHRVIRGFMIQGGDINSRDKDPGNDGMGSPGYHIDAEFNDMKHIPGRISMARSQDPNSAGSQFFICHGAPQHLDGQYTLFGEVIQGMDVLDKMANVQVDPKNNMPYDPIIMQLVRVVSI